ITHEKNGLLVPVGEAKSMEEAMGRLAENGEFAKRLGQEALKVRQRFSEETIMAEWKRVLI
ncbi:MAG: glycosyltransferase family 4 protein, partial [Lachnospiraceae bacterium]|nr:glycosyltransferase family 4 protein [Lachnospiraceae bacterium]